MVASLIRQESDFNPNAVSVKNALGLMQVRPKVGKGVAKQEKLKHFAATQLFTPTVNLQPDAMICERKNRSVNWIR